MAARIGGSGGKLSGTLPARLAAIESKAGKAAMLKHMATLTVGQAKANTRKFRKTGNLDRSIRLGPLTATKAIIMAGGVLGVGYARYVEEGTGIYGVTGKPIRPKTKRFLAWEVGAGGAGGSELRLTGSRRRRKGKRLGGWAFARSVKGRPATPYLRPALHTAAEKSGLKDAFISIWNDAA